MSLFYFIGNCSAISYETKSPPGRIALRRRGGVSLKRPAAGGKSCRAGFFFMRRAAYGQRLSTFATFEQPCKQAWLPGLPRTLAGSQLFLYDGSALFVLIGDGEVLRQHGGGFGCVP